jgi:hypothetical protein
MACLFIPGNAEIRAKVAAQVAAAAEIISKAPARLLDCRLLLKTRFDLVKSFSVPLFRPVPDLQFTSFSHFHLPDQESHRRDRSARREKGNKTSAFSALSAVNHSLFPSK